MNWGNIIVGTLSALAIICVPVATYLCFKCVQISDAYYKEMLRISETVAKTNKEFMDRNTIFKATGYSALVTDEGTIRITFKQNIGDEEMAFVREVELPAWMWTSAVIEATMKLNTEIMEKSKKNENHKLN